GPDAFIRYRQRLPVAFSRELRIRRESGLGPLIAQILRFQLRDYRIDVGGRKHLASDEVGQVILRRAGVETKFNVLRVDSAVVQAGDVAHRADGKREVEADKVRLGRP